MIKESQKWVERNQGLHVENKGDYTSPRISSELPDCSMPLTFDHYSFCSLGCLYCFAYFFKSNNSIIKDSPLKAVNPNRVLNSINGVVKNPRDKALYEHFYRNKFLLHWGGLADPFCNFESTNKVGYRLMKGLGELNYPTLFSFKGDAIFRKKYEKLFSKYAHQKNFAFQISIITADKHLSKYVEMGVPSPKRRIEAIRMLSDMGYWTILRLRPYIIGITDKHIVELLEKSYQAGISGVSMEFFAMDSRANKGMKTRYDWLAKLIKVEDLQKYYAALSPSERGGYMRLNRLIKEPYVKQVYKFCIENNLTFGCSDPDFKELNTSGSCCAMPDKFPSNPDLQNWTRSQLTFYLKQARKRYHKTGKRMKFYFNKVYSTNAEYLDDLRFTRDHISTINKCEVEIKNITLRQILQTQWNNLNSPSNPRNYFHGKIMPIELDEEGNLVFIYQPSEYEERWKKEGLKLTV